MAFRRRTKSYPLFSQEFVIHNHADIGFCLVLCVLIGLMFEVSEITGEGSAPSGAPPAYPCGFPGSSSELGRLTAIPDTTPQPPAPCLASPTLICHPPGTHRILQFSLQP
ncbi:Translocating chain-associated membrane protein 2 [Galemys pyrenaicus]|uniref:Translocating chain-associated membrane protein 2 n=1 Tax=Galemys pyrenaicus TaxID=202257 RepID=A0A8J6AIE5_GALPY|nr:Translocating chain-associated membrane protein 2 [Galemys pyrenaicus]